MSENQKPAYTFADLLVSLQKLTPEQLAQPVHVWGETTQWHPVNGVVVAPDDFVCEDGECWPRGDFGSDLVGTDKEEEAYVKKGEVYLEVND